MREPPSEGAVHVTVTMLSPGVPTTFVGAKGATYASSDVEGVEEGPEPAAFFATTLKV